MIPAPYRRPPEWWALETFNLAMTALWVWFVAKITGAI